MLITDIIGLIASVLATVAYVPQAWKTITTKKTHDLSMLWLVILTVGLVLYTVYGISIHAVPVILSSGAGGSMAAILLAYKIRYR